MLFFCINQSFSCQAQFTKTDWPNLFEQSYCKGYKDFQPLKIYWLKLSNSTLVTDLEQLSYGLDAVLAMFETTDSVSYLDDAIAITKNNIGKSQVTGLVADNRFRLKDTYRGWIDRSNDTSSILYHTESVLTEIDFYQYVCRLLKDIYNNREIYRKARYKDFYNQTLDFVESNIWDKWESRGLRFNGNRYNYLFLVRTHMASHWAYIAAELSFLTKSDTRRNDYLAFVKMYNDQLEKNFYKYGKYISWNQTWNGVNNGGIIQDVSHGNLVVSYIVETYDLGLWKDSDVIQRLINTLKDILWDPKDCLFRDNINGTMFKSQDGGTVGSFQADGFVKLTRYDKSLFAIYDRFVNCSIYLTAWHQFGQLFANLALSEKLLSDSTSSNKLIY